LPVLAACSSRDSAAGAADAGCFPYVSDAALSAPVSFAAGVMPIFSGNCAVGGGTCHGDVATLPYLGSADGSADATSILSTIVSKRSQENAAMDFISPGDPAKSYLMHKMDGDECTLAVQCAQSHTDFSQCGANMPFLSPLLPAAQRDVVRAWIQQGAQNN
jgi:hypothetical protein